MFVCDGQFYQPFCDKHKSFDIKDVTQFDNQNYNKLYSTRDHNNNVLPIVTVYALHTFTKKLIKSTTRSLRSVII